MSRRVPIIFGVVGTCLLLSAGFASEIGLCPAYSYSPCADFFNKLAETLFPVIPLFILAGITYKMREEVYRVWLRFSYWWIPLSMLAILLAPEYNPDWMFPVEKGTVAFFSSVFYALISLVLVGWKYILIREKESTNP